MSFMRKNLMLFLNSLYLSTFTFGGGFAMLPLLRKKYVSDLKLLTAQDMIDVTSIAQASPGGIAVNSNVLIGYRINGIIGALICMIGSCLPPLIIITIISYLYTLFVSNPIVLACLAGMQAGIAGLICKVGIDMSSIFFKGKDIISILILPIAFVCSFFLGLHVLFIFGGCIVISLLRIILFTLRNGFIARKLTPYTVSNTNVDKQSSEPLQQAKEEPIIEKTQESIEKQDLTQEENILQEQEQTQEQIQEPITLPNTVVHIHDHIMEQAVSDIIEAVTNPQSTIAQDSTDPTLEDKGGDE